MLRYLILLSLFIVGVAQPASAWSSIEVRQIKSERPGSPPTFTVADEIGIALFGDPYGRGDDAITISPNGRFVAVETERGLLKSNRIEGELRIYEISELQTFLNQPQYSRAPAPIWRVRVSPFKEGPAIANIRWTSDSKGLAFLLKTSSGRDELAFADLAEPKLRTLSVADQNVTAFAVRDRSHYAYTVSNVPNEGQVKVGYGSNTIVATGLSLTELLFSKGTPDIRASYSNRSLLWADSGKGPHLVLQPSGDPIVIYPEGQRSLALAPKSETLAVALPVSIVPKNWETEYPAAYPEYPYRIRGGRQDLHAAVGTRLVSQYTLVNLISGKITPVTGAPTAEAAGWWAAALAQPVWSNNGRDLLLPGTFLKYSSKSDSPKRPCVVLADWLARSAQCLEPLKSEQAKNGHAETGYFTIDGLGFSGQGTNRVVIERDFPGQSREKQVFVRTAGRWSAEMASSSVPGSKSFELKISQGLNNPPILVATEGEKAPRTIWNPNPQLKRISLSVASVLRWSDADGRKWVGGLYTPAGYVPGHRYPLVIQTHGFKDDKFLPSGIYPTAFAARALASAGIAVLQVRDCPIRQTPVEGACQVEGYKAAIQKLVTDRYVDVNRVGIIGFSRTVYYVLNALIARHMNFAAASITDGVNMGYWQYLMMVDRGQNGIASDASAIIGSEPFGGGLQNWLARSPEFHIQNVRTPLLINAEGRNSLLFMWEPYASLRYLHKPVELMLLDTDEHVLTTPEVRLASQGGSVDWFRFWLQGYESAEPQKAAQYRRWEKLCDMQIAENLDRQAFCVPSRH